MHIAHTRTKDACKDTLFKENICICTTTGGFCLHFSSEVFSCPGCKFDHRMIVWNMGSRKIFFNVDFHTGKFVIRIHFFIIFYNFIK